MSVYQECGTSAKGKANTGAKEQCLEGIMTLPVLTLPDFKFDSLADAKDISKWEEAIAAKQMWPLYAPEEITSANTEDTFFEGRTQQYLTAKGKKITTYTAILGLCSHSALTTFSGLELRQFEFTEDGKVKGVINDAGEVYGQSVKLNVAKRLDATADRPPSTLVTINYTDYTELEQDGAIFIPDFRSSELYGIFDVHMTQVSASATVIKLTVSNGCAGGGDVIPSFIAANFVVKNAAGAVQSVTFTAADANGVYTLTGTGFVTGYTVELDGVVTVGGMSYEDVEPLVITVT